MTLPALGSDEMTLPESTLAEYCSVTSPQGQPRPLDHGTGLVLGLADDVGNGLGLHASGDGGGDGLAEPHLLARLRLAGDDAAGRTVSE